MTTVIETLRIPPPAATADELTLPLCFFDTIWLHFHPIRLLIFYDHPCSEAEFLDTIVPNLKNSLSLTLKHYLTVAANLLYPLHTDRSKPFIRYISGDTVPLTVAVSALDFDQLVGSQAKESDQFYVFIAPMPTQTEEGDYKIVPLIALQATLFPGRGICIGLSSHHCLGDARSVVGFMWAWADIHKHGAREGDSSLLFFDRIVFGDTSSTDNKYWNRMKNVPLKPETFPLPTNRLRASFTLRPSDIQKLKNLVQTNNPSLVHVSSFVVTAAYTWSCVIKSAGAAGEEVDENKTEIFFFQADARGRQNALVDPPVPLNYFGNCIGGGMVQLEHKKLVAEDGFLKAAEAISDQIKTQVNNKENFLKGTDNWSSDKPDFAKMSTFGVSGSPKFDFSKTDFGWGKARRLEVLSMDGEKYSMSLCNSWDSDGGLIVGTSLPKERMEAFAAIFQEGLNF